MNQYFKNQCFYHGVLIGEKSQPAADAFSTRYILGSEFGIRIKKGANLLSKDMVLYVGSMLGEKVPAPFYKGFPESVKKLSKDELLFDQMLHYAITVRTVPTCDNQKLSQAIANT